MNDFLEQIWFDNPVKDYLMAAGVILFIWLVKQFISRYIAGLLYKIVRRIWKGVDRQSFIKLVVKPLGLFLAVLVSIISLYRLHFPAQLDTDIYKFTVRDVAHSLATIFLILALTNLLLRMIDFIALILEERANITPDQFDNQLIVFFKDFFKVILVIIGIMLVLRYAFGLDVSGLLTGLSILGAAIALALRESLENLIASFIIFTDKPFTIGDLVKVQQVTGTVDRIGLRSTRIRTNQMTYVSVPNKQMVDSILDNLSLRTQRRADLILEIGLKTPPDLVEKLLAGIHSVMNTPKVENAHVHLSDITASGIVVAIEYYTAPSTLQEFNAIKQEINLKCLKQIADLGIELADANSGRRM
ncbi:MAG: mechanosensitive ion channel family protein [Chitinophagaceae bacterium]